MYKFCEYIVFNRIINKYEIFYLFLKYQKNEKEK